jgi:hypothetical protein
MPLVEQHSLRPCELPGGLHRNGADSTLVLPREMTRS